MIIVAYVGVYFLAMFFVARDSLAYKFCATTPEGIIVFDDSVKDPIYGIQAKPCTLDQTVEIRRIKNPGLGPQRVQVVDAKTFMFFEPITGNPRIWYHKTSAGEYEFFDRMGNDPETGVPLQIMDQQAREDAIRIQDQRARCPSGQILEHWHRKTHGQQTGRHSRAFKRRSTHSRPRRLS
jgi:hypothetical protein